ncbi:MAG: hypothetical protein ACPG8W_04740 [Candidatus Promineifilaceae bacterium]
MSNFEWQTEDDYDWDKPEQTPPSSSTNQLGKIGIGILIVVLLAGLGWTLSNRLQETVETVTEQTQQDIHASFRLLHESAAARDIEVFNALLSGLDPEWTVGYQLMVGSNGLLDRSPLGWRLASETPELSNVVLSPSLRAAEITATVMYEIPVGNGLYETVSIAQPAVFREGTTRWLYAPPEEGYWGTRETQTGNLLSVTYPTRDKKLALRLQNDLEVAIANRCNSNCDQTFLQVEFSTSPSALADLRTPPLNIEAHNLILPTPTLVGLPVDRAGYQALLGGYADLILTSLFAEQSAYQCCDRIVYYRAQALWELKEAGLRGWPLTQADYESVLLAHNNFVEWPLGWELNRPSAVSAEIQNIAYAMVEYLRTTYPNVSAEYNTTNLSIIDRPIDWVAATFLNSGLQIAADTPDDWQKEQFEAFQQFLIGRIKALDTDETQREIPEQPFMFACNVENGSTLHQFDPSAQSWTLTDTFEQPITKISKLPDPASLWIHFGDPKAIASELDGLSAIWRDGVLQPVTELRLNYTGTSDPLTGHLIVNTQPHSNTINIQYYTVDPSSCTDDNCALTDLAGQPIWSSDLQHFLMLSNRNLLSIETPAGDIINQHFSLAGFWLDETSYAWQSTLSTLNVNTIDKPDESNVWVSWNDLEAALPSDEYRIPSLLYFFWRDEQPQQLYIDLINLLPNSSGNVIYWDRDAQSAEILPYNNTRMLQASPTDRFLLLRENNRTSQGVGYGNVHLYDTIEQRHYLTLPTDNDVAFSWIGEDDRWATLTDGDQTYLIDVLARSQQAIPAPPDGTCVSADWMLPSDN